MDSLRYSGGGTRGRGLAGFVAGILCATSLLTIPAAAAPAAALAAAPDPPAPAMTPIDPQQVVEQDAMTWADYTPVPDTNWSDPSLVPSVEKWKVALVVTDLRDTPFTMSLPAHSTVFGNPQDSAHDIPRDSVPAFLRDFLNVPSALDHFVTLNSYWMEDSFGQYGVQLDTFGPYRLDKNQSQYFLSEYASTSYCPDQTKATGAQSNVLNLLVGDSSWFYLGDVISIAGVSGTRTVVAIPDATHITIANTTLSGATIVGATNFTVASVAGMAVGHSVTIDLAANAETATITALGAGSGSATVALPGAAGDTNVKVSSVSGFAAGNKVWIDAGTNIETATIATVGTAGGTTVRLAAAIGDTTLFVQNRAGFANGDTITIDSGAALETKVVQSTGTNSSGGGQRIVLTTPLANAHDVGAQVSGSGITFTAPLVLAHDAGAAVSGSGVTVAAPLALAHASGAAVYDPAANEINVADQAFIHDCNGNFRTDARDIWQADVGLDVVNSYDNIFYVLRGPGRDVSPGRSSAR